MTDTLSPARKWSITVCVMLVTIMQILDTSVTNVALPHMRGSLSASVEEITWALTLYLAANAVVIPATGWLTGLLGRRRFFLIVTTLFMASSFMSGLAPTLDTLILARIFQGLGAGPIIPLSQAVLWEIFPLHQRGVATAVWGIGVMFGPIVGPTLGGWIVDNWSWRWIFYINLPIGAVALIMGHFFVFDSPWGRRPQRVDWAGLALMTVGFGALQLFLDRGERDEWFDSTLILALAVVAVAALLAFLIRELTAAEPILDLGAFADRNFAVGTMMIAGVGLTLNSSMMLMALYTQQVLGYDAWTAGTVLAPGGLGNMAALILAGRLVVRADQRVLLAFGCSFMAIGAWVMASVTRGVDYWWLVWPRFVQGFGTGFVFVPLATMALATVPKEKLPNATACFNVVRNLGASVGIAVVATLLARRSQFHQATLSEHMNAWDPELTAWLGDLTRRFAAEGADPHTAARQAMATLYRATVEQAHVLAYADDFWLLTVVSVVMLAFIPFLHRVRLADPRVSPSSAGGREGPSGPVVTEG
ncbi:MAG: DHA2 family efflux MFS transporter permease subunit [Candidatus Rokubacteria bacterium]|nr:DHA2 family efflux MFS transporter permease subunit [Candidatus Rokubacteria bacterium]